MYIDVVDLRGFYASRLGQLVRRTLRSTLRQMWPQVKGEVVLGLGYAAPFLRPFLADAQRVLCFMPAAQGVVAWPHDELNRAALVHEDELPLPDCCVDRALLVHIAEQSETLRPMLREVWRVLKPDGKIVVVTANRRGMWAHFEHTPFGHGRPFSRGQLDTVLKDRMFTPGAVEHVLFVPPLSWRTAVASAPAWEKLGRRWWPAFSGVMLMEARKDYAVAAPLRRRAVRLRLAPVPQGAAAIMPVQSKDRQLRQER